MRRLLLLGALLLVGGAGLASAHVWEVISPDQRQTFAYGSERHRQWIARGTHLGVVMHLTNDPYVDQVNFRQYDDFDFEFPDVTRARGGGIFFYHPPGNRPVPVAVEHAGFFGPNVRLLPSSTLAVRKVHGLLTLILLVSDTKAPHTDDEE